VFKTIFGNSFCVHRRMNSLTKYDILFILHNFVDSDIVATKTRLGKSDERKGSKKGTANACFKSDFGWKVHVLNQILDGK